MRSLWPLIPVERVACSVEKQRLFGRKEVAAAGLEPATPGL